ncbi:MAG: hypothetical protein JWM27_1647 [Gemmatimonadetes bacterium]|nr:hypothetical protein [Gemmatimonadota bacterium]
MSITGTVTHAAAGLRGFDVNATVSASVAQQFKAAGYAYCIRYVPFGTVEDPDLTAAEAGGILAAGLALMPVQHVRYPGWLPSGALGTQYGQAAVQYLQGIGFPAGVNVWCDMECVGTVPQQDAIDYCNSWYAAVAAGGYVPGLYVGYEPGMTDPQIYDLRFTHYWAAYNANSSVPTRGYQLVQSPQSTHIAGMSYDDDVTCTDKLGGTALWLAAS